MISNPTIEAGPVTRHNQTDVKLVTGDEWHEVCVTQPHVTRNVILLLHIVTPRARDNGQQLTITSLAIIVSGQTAGKAPATLNSNNKSLVQTKQKLLNYLGTRNKNWNE